MSFDNDQTDGLSGYHTDHSSLKRGPPPRDDKTPTGAIRVHHHRYYIKDDMTVFLINGEILFRVQRHYLDRESEVFRSYPSGTDEDPIPLPNVVLEEFEALLEYFYDNVHGDATKTREEWALLLSISAQFKMEKVRNRAISELTRLTWNPVDQIVLALKYDVPAWLKPAYVMLCKRQEPIRDEEAEKLGLSTTVKLARAREIVRDPVLDRGKLDAFGNPVVQTAPLHWHPIPTERILDTALIERIVTEVFWPGRIAHSIVDLPVFGLPKGVDETEG